MAKIKVVDQAVVITSSLTNGEISKAVRFFPDALVLKEKNEDGKLVPVFAVTMSKNSAEVSRNGICFPEGAKEDKAAVTITIPKTTKDKKMEIIKDYYGKTLMRLNELEKAFGAQNDKFDAEYKKLEESIEIE